MKPSRQLLLASFNGDTSIKRTCKEMAAITGWSVSSIQGITTELERIGCMRRELTSIKRNVAQLWSITGVAVPEEQVKPPKPIKEKPASKSGKASVPSVRNGSTFAYFVPEATATKVAPPMRPLRIASLGRPIVPRPNALPGWVPQIGMGNPSFEVEA